MEKEPTQSDTEIRRIDGKLFQKVDSGYTVREYFSHSTPDRGPGPGYDTRWRAFEEYGVDDESDLPDEVHYIWEEIQEN